MSFYFKVLTKYVLAPSFLLGISSYDELEEKIKKLNSKEAEEILAWVRELNDDHIKKKLGITKLLYHGSPQKKIEKEGLQITKGERSGFMGSTRTVQNQGIFLTDSKRMARFFGENRAENRSDAVVYEAFVKLGKVLDLTNPSSLSGPLKKLGLKLINEDERISKTKLATKDVWKLLDMPDFTKTVKTEGYDTVRFKEEPHVNKASGEASSHTYMVFDPANIILRNNEKNYKITSLQDVWEHLKGTAY